MKAMGRILMNEDFHTLVSIWLIGVSIFLSDWLATVVAMFLMVLTIRNMWLRLDLEEKLDNLSVRETYLEEKVEHMATQMGRVLILFKMGQETLAIGKLWNMVGSDDIRAAERWFQEHYGSKNKF